MPVPRPEPAAADAGIFAGLTPPLAALLVMTYTEPGDVVMDATGDLAVEGPARAGGRDYRLLDLNAPVVPDSGDLAQLILVTWLADGTASGTSVVPALEQVLAECRTLLTPSGHLLVVARQVLDTDLRDVAEQVAVATRASGLGRLLHLIQIVRQHEGAEEAASVVDPARTPGLIAVASGATSGRHA